MSDPKAFMMGVLCASLGGESCFHWQNCDWKWFPELSPHLHKDWDDGFFAVKNGEALATVDWGLISNWSFLTISIHRVDWDHGVEEWVSDQLWRDASLEWQKDQTIDLIEAYNHKVDLRKWEQLQIERVVGNRCHLFVDVIGFVVKDSDKGWSLVPAVTTKKKRKK